MINSPIVQTGSIHVRLTDMAVLGMKAEALVDQLQQQDSDLRFIATSDYTQDTFDRHSVWFRRDFSAKTLHCVDSGPSDSRSIGRFKAKGL